MTGDFEKSKVTGSYARGKRPLSLGGAFSAFFALLAQKLRFG
jgi:hypothetical protein